MTLPYPSSMFLKTASPIHKTFPWAPALESDWDAQYGFCSPEPWPTVVSVKMIQRKHGRPGQLNGHRSDTRLPRGMSCPLENLASSSTRKLAVETASPAARNTMGLGQCEDVLEAAVVCHLHNGKMLHGCSLASHNPRLFRLPCHSAGTETF